MIVQLKGALKSYLWGGTNLKTEWHKESVEESLSESWELSFHPDGPSLIASGENAGKALSEVATRADWGERCQNFSFFPVLNKLIDAAKPLSVQVHPSDEYALAHEGQYGKTEMWHILHAEKGAYLYLGFNQTMSRLKFAGAIADNTICNYLNKVPVYGGETYLIPSGTVHAIGAGITLYEVQQNSSLTYRVYDYDRVDKNGNKRELHIEKARAVINFNRYEVPDPARGEMLGQCQYFTAYRLQGERKVGLNESFVCLTVIGGNVQVEGLKLQKGDSVFISAGEQTRVEGDGTYILTCVGNL